MTTRRTRMETAHLLCDSDNFEDVISTLKKEGAELERELDEARAELAELWSRFDKQMESEAEVERLRSTMRSFINFMDENLGTTADWPMEAAFDDEETCQRHCDHLNAMKRLVKPEDIN